MLKVEFFDIAVDGVINVNGERKIVAINGFTDKSSIVELTRGKAQVSLRLKDKKVINELSQSTFEEAFIRFRKITLEDIVNIQLMNVSAHVEYFTPYGENETISFEFEIEIDSSNWNKSYSVKKFFQNFSQSLRHKDSTVQHSGVDNQIAQFGFSIGYRGISGSTIISEFLNDKKRIIEDCANETYSLLNLQIEENIFSTVFNFPETLKTSCKQYLVYFAQFLNDLGIQAETEFKEDIYGTLFKVVPKEPNEALQNIKDALDIYINAPAAPNFESFAFLNGDIAAMQWQANIMHLKSQLMLAHSVIQAKDAAIQSLQLSNYQYKQIVDSNDKRQSQSEDVIPGVVSVSKLESHGVALNLAEVWRRLKRRLQ